MIELEGVLSGGDESRIDRNTPPGAIFIDGLDLVRYLDLKKLDGAAVSVIIVTPDVTIGPIDGNMYVSQGYGDSNGVSLGVDLLEMETHDGGQYINLIDILLKELGNLVLFNCKVAK